MKKHILAVGLMVAFCFGFTGAAKADNIHLCNVSTGCSYSSVIVTNPSNPNIYISGNPTGDPLFLAILDPILNTSGTWHSGKLWTVLGETGGSVYPNLSSAISQESGAGLGINPLSFNVSDIALGNWTSDGAIAMPTGQPTGALIMAFTETGGNLGLVTPWSSSLALGAPPLPPPPVPEPMSLLLFGSGVAMFLAKKGLRKA
jgi:hypothetical protein